MIIDIEKITNFLQNISVAENYNWEVPFRKGQGDNIFLEEDRNSFEELMTNFERNVHLKTLLSEKIIKAKNNNDDDALTQIFEWTVHDWGGIRNGRKNIKKLFKIGMKAIENEKLGFQRIASTSKILSFYKPNEYIIYDSRIAYSLNAIMFLVDASKKYFPVPAGTNSKMNAFNIEVLIRLKHKPDVYKRTGSKKLISQADKILFFNDDEAYSKINETIKKINIKFYKNDPEKQFKPFYTEMLLFSIADTLIYDKIFEKVKLEIEA
jgi:hypothetical protein